MAFKTNYHHQRTERDRLRQAKKDSKLQQKKELMASRKAEQQPDGEPPLAPEDGGGPD